MDPEVRIIQWTAPGYEESFTQYLIIPDANAETEENFGTLWITQIALYNNIARAIGGTDRPVAKHGTIQRLREMVDELISASKLSGCEEISDP
jgi:hypothetical protein